MLITAWFLVAVYVVAAALAIGGYATKNEALLAFGASLFLVAGWIVFMNGISIETSSLTVTNYTIAGNATVGETTRTTYEYDENKGVFTNSLGVLSLLFGGTLFFYLNQARIDRKRRYESGEE